MPSMFRASPWEVIPLEAQRGGSAWQRGIVFFALGADVEFLRYKIRKETGQIQVVEVGSGR